MSPEFGTALRTSRPLQAATAAIAIAALVGIAMLVDSHSLKPVISSKASALAAAQATRPTADLALAPNETLVGSTAKTDGPLMPRYAPPAPPPAAPTPPDRPQTPEAASQEAKAAMV